MKKNKMMRIASVLLVAVILTTCAISGTYAKYVTSGNSSDNARVAKWGVVITANGSTFAKNYNTDDNTVAGTIAQSVISSGDDKNVVAPGTKGDLANATITGTPEVAVNVRHVATLTVTGWKLGDDTEYFPIIFTVNNETYAISGMKDSAGIVATHEYATINALVGAVKVAIENNSANYPAGTDLSQIDSNGNGYVHVSWEWGFDKNDDENDTYLGNQAKADNAATISLTVTTTVTQID